MLGLVFVLAPAPASALFGIPASEAAHPYVRALGFRDLALALYLFGLLIWASRRALRIVLGASVLIPACDVVLVASVTGLSHPLSLSLHAGAGACLAGLAFWLRD